MFLVNFVGSYDAVATFLPILKHHHTHVSYADTIMPQFFLAVGFAYRMTFLRRLEKEGAAAAYWHATKRILGLLVVAFVVHTLGSGVANWEQFRSGQVWSAVAAGLKREYFQTLTHIAVTSLWVMPVIAARPSSAVVNSMNPKPFDSPLERSVATFAEMSLPYGTARSLSCESLICFERFPTYSFI
jgi:hypothetical protein